MRAHRRKCVAVLFALLTLGTDNLVGGESSAGVEPGAAPIKLGPEVCCAEVGTDYALWIEEAQLGLMRGEIANPEDYPFDVAWVKLVVRRGRVLKVVAFIPPSQYERVKQFCLSAWAAPTKSREGGNGAPWPAGVDEQTKKEHERLFGDELYQWRFTDPDGFQPWIVLNERLPATFYLPGHPVEMEGEPFVKLAIMCHMLDGYSADSTDCPLFQEDD